MRALVAAAVLVSLAAAPARAERKQRVAYAVGATVGNALGLALLAGGIALRFEAPNADTLMVFKREASASDTLIGVGTAVVVLGAIFTIVGGALFDLRESPRVGLFVSPSGGGLAWSGRF